MPFLPYLPAAYVDVAAGRAVIQGETEAQPSRAVDFPAGAPLAALLADTIPPHVRRVYLVGELPGDGTARGALPWLRGPLAAGWEQCGEQQLDGKRLVFSLRRPDTRRRVDVRDIDEWLGGGAYAVETAARALACLLAELRLKHGFRYAQLGSTPGTTGLALWDSQRAAGSYPPLPDDLQDLIRETSGQGRNELFPAAGGKLPGLYYLDGRFMYAACCANLGIGPATRDERPEYAGDYAPARYRVRFTVPAGWAHVGLLGVKAGDVWIYPSVPGESAETWADDREVKLARDHGWHIEIRERLLFTKPGAGSEPAPLNNWIRRLLEVREAITHGPYDPETAALMVAAVRAIVLHTIGQFHGRQLPAQRYVPEGEPIPDDATAIEPEGAGFLVTAPRARTSWQRQHSHPEYSAAIWARARCRLLTAALDVPRGALVALRTDALYSASDPGWPDDGKNGTFRLKGAIRRPVAAPGSYRELFALRDRAEAALRGETA